MHRTIGTMNGCGIRIHDNLLKNFPSERVLAAIGFFLLSFGCASIGMAAIALSGTSSGTNGPALTATDAAVHNNDGYLEGYAQGPGRGWFVLGQARCATEKLRTVVLFEPMSEASANRTSTSLGSFVRVSARRELLLHDVALRRKAAGELPLFVGASNRQDFSTHSFSSSPW
jgi:hypothetical protein